MESELVDRNDRPVDLKGKPISDLLQMMAIADGLINCGEDPDIWSIDSQAPVLERDHQIVVALKFRTNDIPDVAAEHIERPLGRDSGIELPDRVGGCVSGVGIGGQPSGQAVATHAMTKNSSTKRLYSISSLSLSEQRWVK